MPDRCGRAGEAGLTVPTLLRNLILLIMLLAAGAAGPSPLGAEKPYRFLGRPLAEALEHLKQRGLKLIFSSAVVDPALRVNVEPRPDSPREILDQILPPLGLKASEGPAGSIVIVATGRGPVSGALRGTVLSANRRDPVTDATIRVADTDQAAYTNPDGSFLIEDVPAGDHRVVVQAPRFAAKSLGNVRVRSGDNAPLIVELDPHPSYVEQLVVTPSRFSIVQSEQDQVLLVSGDDSLLVPTFGGDVSRVIAGLPGVAAPDNAATFNVRGSESRDVSLILDGMELYVPFHLRSLHSPFSFIDSKNVDRIEFLGGGFTADLGDRMGGIVRMTTGVPDSPHKTRIEAGTINSRVSFGAPTRSNSGPWLVSGRAWYPEAIRNTIELGDTGLAPHFWDAYFRYPIWRNASTTINAHGLLAYDRLNFTESGGGEEVRIRNRNGYFWVRGIHSTPGGTLSETVLSGGRISRSRMGISEPTDVTTFTVNDERVVDFYSIKHDITWPAGEDHLIKAGFELRPLDAKYRYTSITSPAGPSGKTVFLDPSGSTAGAYAAYRTVITPRIATEIGLRWDEQTYTEDEQLSPRLNAVWQLGERSEIRLGAGRFSQSQRIHELRIEDGEESFFRAVLSDQVALTVQHQFRSGIRIRADGYYRRLLRVQPRFENYFNPLELFPETESDRVFVDPERARLRGGEILVSSPPEAPFFWRLSYARSWAEDVIDGDGVPRSWDQPHSIKLLAGYRRAGKWWISVSGAAHTGWPTTPVTGRVVTLPGGGTQLQQVRGDRNSDRFPTYIRADFKASRAIAVERGRLRLDLEIINLTDRENVCCVDEYVLDLQPGGVVRARPEHAYWLGFTPSASLLWEF